MATGPTHAGAAPSHIGGRASGGVGAGANLVGSRYANAGNTVRLPGYVTADAAAWWRQGPWGVQLNVYNITDARYIVSSHGANGNMNLPGAPRNVMLKLSYRM